MSLLLDTCTFIWLSSDPQKLSERAKKEIEECPENGLHVSFASFLEIAIKQGIGKLQTPDEPRKWVNEQMEIWRIRPIPLSETVIFASACLPWHHRDPFDRLIIATARAMELPIVSPDAVLNDYHVEVIW